MTEIEGVLIHRRMAPLYEALKKQGFPIEPYRGLNTSREGWVATNGVKSLTIALSFGTQVGITEDALFGNTGEFDIWMETNTWFMFNHFVPESLAWDVTRKIRPWVKIRDENMDVALSFCTIVRRRLEKHQSKLTARVVNYYLCLLHGTLLPKDVVRMFAQYYYKISRDEIIRKLNTLPQYVLDKPENF